MKILIKLMKKFKKERNQNNENNNNNKTMVTTGGVRWDGEERSRVGWGEEE